MKIFTNFKSVFLIILILSATNLFSQGNDEEDLLKMLDEIAAENEEETNYTSMIFRSTRVINSQSVENMGEGTLDFRISHRFGRLNTGIYEMFGLDKAQIRLAFEYAVLDNLTLGIGRSSFMKEVDAFVKYGILRQSTGEKEMPFSLYWFSSATYTTDRNFIPIEDDGEYFNRRFSYAHQLLIGRKFSDFLSVQLMPTLVHRNLVRYATDENDVYALGAATSFNFLPRTSLNLEYFYLLPGTTADNFNNSFSIGFDLETGGHVFQLHLSNSLGMIEKSFIPQTNGRWDKGDIHFGFNISRVFQFK